MPIAEEYFGQLFSIFKHQMVNRFQRPRVIRLIAMSNLAKKKQKNKSNTKPIFSLVVYQP